MKAGNVGLTLLTLCLIAWAAGDALIAPQSAASPKPTASSYGAEAITIPQMLSYQGKLTDTLGQPVADSTYSVVFRLFTVPSGGSAFWNETQSVTTKGGLFSVLLGSASPIGAIPDGGAVYLGMTVAGGAELAPRLRIVSAAYAFKADTANYALSGGTSGDNAWVRSGSDSVLYTIRPLGLSRGGAGNALWGSKAFTHVNFGTACTTGRVPADIFYATVGGGTGNTAWENYTTVAGGCYNVAQALYASVGGGEQNVANGRNATVGAGFTNSATDVCATVGGGWNNVASGASSLVGGGKWNVASGERSVIAGGESNQATGVGATVGGGYIGHAFADNATVGGGYTNVARGTGSTVAGGLQDSAGGYGATIGGGYLNVAGDGVYPTVGGGTGNRASGDYACVPGGTNDTAYASWSFAANGHSVAGNNSSAAFNNRTTRYTQSLRCSVLDADVFDICMDDPLDPDGAILGQFGICSPELVLLYRGSAVIGAGARVEVRLPDYFDAVNRRPMIQVSGIGTSDVYVAEKEANNRFVIGGKPGTEVYWTVTGERNDPVGEMCRLTMPVEQPRTGHLVGRSIADDALCGLLPDLERLGYGGRYTFRTPVGRQKYEAMQRELREAEQLRNARPIQPSSEAKAPDRSLQPHAPQR